LRHTYVSLLIAQNVHPKVIVEQAGHASVAMTMDRYAHLFPDADAKVKNAPSAAFGSAATPNVVALRAASH
jgi:integrase